MDTKEEIRKSGHLSETGKNQFSKSVRLRHFVARVEAEMEALRLNKEANMPVDEIRVHDTPLTREETLSSDDAESFEHGNCGSSVPLDGATSDAQDENHSTTIYSEEAQFNNGMRIHGMTSSIGAKSAKSKSQGKLLIKDDQDCIGFGVTDVSKYASDNDMSKSDNILSKGRYQKNKDDQADRERRRPHQKQRRRTIGDDSAPGDDSPSKTEEKWLIW